MNEPATYQERTYTAQQCVEIAKVATVNDFSVSSVLHVIQNTDLRHLFQLNTVEDCIFLAELIERVMDTMRGNTTSRTSQHIAEWLRMDVVPQ